MFIALALQLKKTVDGENVEVEDKKKKKRRNKKNKKGKENAKVNGEVEDGSGSAQNVDDVKENGEDNKQKKIVSYNFDVVVFFSEWDHILTDLISTSQNEISLLTVDLYV